MVDCDLQSDEVLLRMRKDLVLQRKDPEAFLEMIFGSRDKIWVDHCSSIILEYENINGTREDLYLTSIMLLCVWATIPNKVAG